MIAFACHRCRQPLHLPNSLSDDVAQGGTLTQSAYDVIEAESVLLGARVRKERQHASVSSDQKETEGQAHDDATPGNEESNSGDASPKESDPDQRPSNALSSRLSLTASLFDMLSSTQPPRSWTPSSKSPLPPTSAAARTADQTQRRSRARLPLGPSGSLTPAIDHPLCDECTNVLLTVMEGQLDDLRRERDAYLAFEEELKRTIDEDNRENEAPATQEEIDSLLEQEHMVERDLQEAEEQVRQVDKELQALDDEEKFLQEEEDRFWQKMNELTLDASNLSDQRSSLQASLAQDRALLNRLELTNVYNDAFSIGYDGGYATINGLRLGRMPNDPRGIEWSEINAAWGQTAFLLVTLARRCPVTFADYKVNAIGSFSTVEKLGERKEVYELHGSGDWQLGRLLTQRRFDHAMVAFLDCLRQLCVAVQQRDENVKLPHTILRDKIGGASIRLQFGSDEIWTRALRNVLMTLKILLAWSIKSSDDEVDL